MKKATRPPIFKCRQTEPELILCAVGWGPRYSLSFQALHHFTRFDQANQLVGSSPDCARTRSPLLKKTCRAAQIRSRTGVTTGFRKNIGWRGGC